MAVLFLAGPAGLNIADEWPESAALAGENLAAAAQNGSVAAKTRRGKWHAIRRVAAKPRDTVECPPNRDHLHESHK